MQAPQDNLIRLLLACARLRLNERQAGAVRSLAMQQVDWERFARAADRHGVLPLVCRNLEQAAGQLMPEEELRQLNSRARKAAARSFALACELPEILDLFQAHGIRALPFKGPALSTFLYGEPTLREFVDLDVIVAPHDARRAIDLLLSCGYAGAHGAAPANSHCSLFSNRHGVNLEIQWSLADRWGLRQSAECAPLAFEELWRHRENVVVCGRPVPTLCAQAMVLVLCVHGARHGWSRLVWLCDFAALAASRPDIDWARAFQSAVACHCRRRLWLALSLAAGLLGAELPPEAVTQRDRDRAMSWLAAQIRRGVLAEPDADAQPGCASELAGLAFAAAMLDTRRERLRVWLEFLRRHLKPNDRDQRALRLPPQLAPVYYLLRPVRLLMTYGLHPAFCLLTAAVRRF
jgi:hypothetical protein